MWLQDLQVTGLRNLTDLRITPAAGLNIIAGPNASGKTAILEAIHLLARGRSFRTSRAPELIQHHKSALQVIATVVDDSGRLIPAGVERDHGQTRVRFDGAAVRSLSNHARYFPLVLITPDSHDLLAGRPGRRRHWLDWGLFHVEPGYLDDWRDCFHALRQRNALLKRPAPDIQFEPWELALSRAAVRIDAARGRFSSELAVTLAGILSELIPGTPEIDYRRGWERDADYPALLSCQRRTDRDRGFTGHGPHRADLVFCHEGRAAHAVLSRGQAKLYVAGLMLALARLLADQGRQPLILIDDLAAELDAGARERFLDCLLRTEGQVFVTAVDTGQVTLRGQVPGTVFHVEHGGLVKVVQ